jgi:cobalamin biosynthesis protein CbiD
MDTQFNKCPSAAAAAVAAVATTTLNQSHQADTVNIINPSSQVGNVAPSV